MTTKSTSLLAIVVATLLQSQTVQVQRIPRADVKESPHRAAAAVLQVDPVPEAITPTAESEPNNTPGTAQALIFSPTAFVTAAINPVADVDFYTFTAPAGSRAWIVVDTGNSISGDRDTVLDLFAADGTTVIETDDDDGTGNGGDGTEESGFASTIAGRTLTAGGTYFVRVKGFSASTSIVNPYRLFVFVSTVAASPEVEPNNTAATANVFNSTTVRSASISVAGEADYYSIAANAGDTIVLQGDGNPERDATNTDLVLEFRGPADDVLLTVDSGLGGSPTNPDAEGANFTVPTSGVYFVRVRGFGTSTGTYHLMIANTTDRTENFVNSTAIVVPGTGTGPGTGSPYPSNITVAGFAGRVAKVTVTLKGITHTFPDDIDVLLVGPSGVNVMLMSDVGGDADFVGGTLTLDSSASTSLPDVGPLTSGTFLPTNVVTNENLPPPAPAGPYTTTTLAAFNGFNPNGTWSLYVFDDASSDAGNIANGWELAITAGPAATSDFTGNGTAEPAVYRPSTGTWFVHGQGPVQFGLPGDVIVPGNDNGDLATDRAVYRRSNGTWYVHGQTPVQWGLPGDIPVPGDYNGDLVLDIAVYRPSSGMWFVRGQANVQFGLPGDIPVPADYNGGGTTDRAVYRPSTGTWFVQGIATVQWGLAGDIPVPADFDGDTEADLAVYRPSDGTWYTKLSTTNYVSSTTVQLGLPGDIPIPNSPVAYVLALRSTLATQSRVSDFDGDRLSDLTVFRPGSATWFTRRSTTDYATSSSVQWGLSGDVPMPGDYDGDGQTDNAVYRPSTGEWHFLKSSSLNTTSGTIAWGLAGDVPVAGDYDGDGINDPAVYRPSTGEWLILRSSSGFTVFQQIQWGLSGDVPMTGDFEGDAISDLTVYRPSSGTWFTKFSSSGYVTSASRQWGLSGDVAVPGEYDGDGTTDHAVYRPSDGTWYILKSSTNQTTHATVQWGLTSDLPVPGDFDGDRRTDVAVWRPSNATWYLLLSSTNNTVFDQIQWGLSSDIPILKRP
jgi:subtilisin-like proprotein convertase family protein